jgi:hypothetical protein
MSFKHLFDKAQTLKSLSNKSAAEIGSTIESSEFQSQDIIKERRFLPAVDYSTASNFARYGSAERYYRDSIDRIYKTYPYDGSLRERLEWENESTEIDLHIYETLYPRSTGYAIMSADGWGTQVTEKSGYGWPSSLEYIYLKGGPHPNPDGMSPLYLQFTGSNYYDTDSNRTSNLKYDLSGSGVTVEFWLKKDEWIASLTTREGIFDMWNGVTDFSVSQYGRLRISLDSSNEGSSPFSITALSGTTGITELAMGSSLTIADGSWHHYAVSLMSASSGIETRLYVDGNLNDSSTSGTGFSEVTGALQGWLGALGTHPVDGVVFPDEGPGGGRLSGSLDEFRYWKTQRSSQDIGRFWFTQVGGGTNKDPMPFINTLEVANTKLGVYYKFNEGITSTASADLDSAFSTVLDYSGRVTNGTWTGYSSNSRNTGSAIISSSAAIKEFEDPIIYPFSPSVSTVRANLITSGSAYDVENTAMIYGSIPSWITEEDDEEGSELQNLTQIMASYLDTLHLQIEALNKLKDIDYVSGSNKPTIFAEKMLASQGLIAPELFIDASIIEKLGDRSENRVYEKNLSEVKNLIYQNLYNNLTYIYKSKGTEKAFRNAIRCFGVDDELIKINMYANNVEFDFTTNRKNQVSTKKYVDFNTLWNRAGTVYQFQDPGDTANTYGFISSSAELTGGFAFTLQSEVMFPLKFDKTDNFYQNTNIISSSLFGVHSTTVQPSETAGSETAQSNTTVPDDDGVNFQVYAVRDDIESPNVQFVLTSSAGGYIPKLTSSLFLDVYNNSKWNLAVKVYQQRYPWTGEIPDAGSDTYIIEFEGIHVDSGIILDRFNVTGSTPAGTSDSFITGSRRVYIGAHKTNITGGLLQYSDTKIGSCRFWLDRLTTEDMEAHAYDPENYGRADAGLYPFPFDSSASYGNLPAINTLALNWNFNQNTGSSALGDFRVADISSGSATMAAAQNAWLGNILYYQHPGSGSGFRPSTTTVTDKTYLVASKQNLPEAIESSDMITVLSQQDEVEFTQDSRPQNYFLAFEKSMQQAVSEQMINYFASLSDLNTLIGAPVNRYRSEYKGLKFLRQRFYETVSNSEIDFEKFFEYYKWIDGALSTILGQLAPISLDFDPNIRTLIESHILERSKYQNKFPFLAESEPDLSGTIGTIATPITVNSIINDAQGTGIESAQAPTKRVTGMPNTSLLNSWKYDHAPLPTASWAAGARPEQNGLSGSRAWWQNRAERGGLSQLQILNATGGMPSGALADRQVLLNAIEASNNRTLGRPYRFSGGGSVVLGGVARHPSQRKGVVYEATAPAGPTVGQGTYGAVPSDIMVAKSADVESLISSSDVYFPFQKVRYGFGMGVQSASYEVYERDSDGATVAPFSLYSSSISDAISSEMSNFTGSTIITNMHADLTSDQTDVPMQGPFTEKFVGGRQHRHIELNQSRSSDDSLSMDNNFNGLDTRVNRPEGFRVQMGHEFTGSNTGSPWKASSGHLQVVSPQYPELDTAPGTTNLYDRPKANLPREEYAKRPVNIKNIMMTTASLSASMSGALDHNRIGNYTKNYEVVQTSGRTQNDPFFQDQSFDFSLNPQVPVPRQEGRYPFAHVTQSDQIPYAWQAYRAGAAVATAYELGIATDYANFGMTGYERTITKPSVKRWAHDNFSFSFWISRSMDSLETYSNQTILHLGSYLQMNTPDAPSNSFTDGVRKWYIKNNGSSGSADNGKLVFVMKMEHSDITWTSAAAVLHDTGWSHICMTFTSASNPAVRLYVNGDNSVGMSTSDTFATAGLFKTINGGGRFFNVPDNTPFDKARGISLADVSYWNVDLSADNVELVHGRTGSVIDCPPVRWDYSPGAQDLSLISISGASNNYATGAIVAWWRMGSMSASALYSWGKNMLDVYFEGGGEGANFYDGVTTTGSHDVIFDVATYSAIVAGGTLERGGAQSSYVGAYSASYTFNVGNAELSYISESAYPVVGGGSSSIAWAGVDMAPFACVLTAEEFPVPARTGSDSNQTIIVNRFGAPGSYTVRSRGYMDPAHEELSVYNAMPFRNFGLMGSGGLPADSIQVRDQLDKPRGFQTNNKLHCGPFGADATYGEVTLAEVAANASLTVTEPSYHKIQRNTRTRLEITSSDADPILEASGGTFSTSSTYDNAFVQHSIPQSDRNYMWITSSLTDGANFYGFDQMVLSNPRSAVRVPELSVAVQAGPSGSSGSAFVTGAYPYGSQSAPSAQGQYEPPYTTLIESGNINFAGFAYSNYASRYVDLSTHILEPPNYTPNKFSYIFSGSANESTNGYGAVTFVNRGQATPWRPIGGNWHAAHDGKRAMSVSWWMKPNYTGSYAQSSDGTGTNDNGHAAYMRPWHFSSRIRDRWRREVVLSPTGSGDTVPSSSVDSPSSWNMEWCVDGNSNEDGQVAVSGTYTDKDPGGAGANPFIGSIKNGVWQHVVVTYDGEQGQRDGSDDPILAPFPGNASAWPSKEGTEAVMKVYINGTDAGATQTDELGEALGIDGAFCVGNSYVRTYDNCFIGELDELQIYAGALNPESVADLYRRRNTNMFGFTPVATSSMGTVPAGGSQLPCYLLSWYRFGNLPEDSTSYIRDQQGNADLYQVAALAQYTSGGANGLTSSADLAVISPYGPTSGSSASGSTLYEDNSGSLWQHSFITFNQSTLNLNGPYQHPTWKQIRTGEHPVARRLRETNRISVLNPPPMVPVYISGAADPVNVVRGKSSTTFTDYVEQPFSTKYRPFVAAFEDNTDTPDPTNNAVARISYGNNITYFSNEGLNSKLNIQINTRENQAYAELQDFIDKSELSVYAAYTERVFPSEKNVYQDIIRTRSEYKTEDVWVSSRTNRKFPVTNSQGYWDSGAMESRNDNASPWPLDAPMWYTQLTNSQGFNSIYNGNSASKIRFAYGFNMTGAVTASELTGASPPGFSTTLQLPSGSIFTVVLNNIEPTTGSGAGELQNTYTRFGQQGRVGSLSNVVSTNATPGMSGTIHPGACYVMPVLEVGQTDLASPWGAGYPTFRGPDTRASLIGFHPWVAPLQENIDPYRPYDEYAELVRLAGKDHTIVPEYRISELMEDYLSSDGGVENFLAKLDNLFSLTGAVTPDSSDNKFYTIYSNTDFMNLFNVVDADLTGQRSTQERNIRRLGTTLEASALLSFLPYKGFYPAERSLKLANYFSKSMGSYQTGLNPLLQNNLNINGTGSEAGAINGGVKFPVASPYSVLSRVLLEPLFAPGILFNTIKSGIAVSHFALRNTSSVPDLPIEATMKHASFVFAANVGIVPKEGYYEYNFNSSASVQSASIASSSLPCLNIAHSGAAAIGATSLYPECYRSIPGGVLPSSPTEYGRRGYFLHKVPFEAIRRPQDYLSRKALEFAPHGIENPDTKLSSVDTGWMYDTGLVSSSLSNSFGNAGPLGGAGSIAAGQPNYLKIRWEGNMSSKLYELAIDNFLCESVNFFQKGLSNYLSREETEFRPVTKNHYYGMRVFLKRSVDENRNPNFGMYSRATAFGAPVAVSGTAGVGITMAHLTPPYYNGSAHVDLIWKAPYSDRPALQDILSDCITEFRRDIEVNVNVGGAGSLPTSTNPGGALSYNATVGSVNDSATGVGAEELQTGYEYNKMMITASVNIFDKVATVPEGTTDQKVRWLIQSKFETPILNFYDTPCLPHPTSSIAESPINVTSSEAPFQIRGMWHQYGRIPTGSEGVVLGIQDLPIEYSSSFYSGSIKVDSLREVVGFGLPVPRKVGQLKETKNIREAVVVVPFWAIENDRRFARLLPERWMVRAREFAEKRRSQGRDWSFKFWDAMADRYDRQTDLLSRYVFPPTLDFLTNDVRPIFFDAFEFDHTLSQKDLQNIWQNLPPLSNQKFEKQTAAIEVGEYFTNRFFTSRQQNLQWMVFKVKQRAAKDYDIFSKQGLTKETPLIEPSLDTPYSFNWPYDYFSLVELVKIDETVKYLSKDIEIPEIVEPPIVPELGAPLGTTQASNPGAATAGTYTEAEATVVLNRLGMPNRRRRR